MRRWKRRDEGISDMLAAPSGQTCDRCGAIGIYELATFLIITLAKVNLTNSLRKATKTPLNCSKKAGGLF